MRVWFIVLMLAFATLGVQAKEAAPLAQDEAVEKRLVDISSELRCLVCQNDSLSGSRAELAYDLRREIRSMIKDGKSDKEIMGFMVDRYGDFVLYNPPLKPATSLLWIGPFVLLLGGLAWLGLLARKRSQQRESSPGLTDEEQRRLLELKKKLEG